jgi:hypothetical protein
MKKIKNTMQALLFIVFAAGVIKGLETGNMSSILVNGIIVLAIIQAENENRY